MTTMADLADGVRACWPATGNTGTITTRNGRVWIEWDSGPVHSESVSDQGRVHPADLVIIGEA